MDVVITFQSKVLTKAVTKETTVNELVEFAASGLQLEGAELCLSWRSGENGESMPLLGKKTLQQYGVRNGDTLEVGAPLLRAGTVLKLKVILGARQELQLAVTDDLTVSELVKYLSSRTGLSEKSLILKYQMVFLMPHKQLRAYDIRSHDTLEVLDKELKLIVCDQEKSVTITGRYIDKVDDFLKKVAEVLGKDWTELNLKFKDKYLLNFEKTLIDCELKNNDTLINEDFLIKCQEVGGTRKFEKKIWRNLYIYCIKIYIRTQFGLRNYKVTLIHNGIELNVNNSPMKYGIRSGDIIEMKFQELKNYYLYAYDGNRNFKIDFEPSISVVEFKKKVMTKAAITTGNVELIAEDHTMVDARCVIDYDLDAATRIQILITIVGGC